MLRLMILNEEQISASGHFWRNIFTEWRLTATQIISLRSVHLKMAASIKVVKSRFALLKVEGDDDEIISQKTDQQKQTLNTKSKKKSKKKSNSAKIKVENDEVYIINL